jgi:hypothetical protein
MRAASPPATASWTALLAGVALGCAGAALLHVEVRSEVQLDPGRSYRLVVHSYDRADPSRFGQYERPVASTQRSVTAEELRSGVRVGLLEFQQERGESDSDTETSRVSLVVAWVEEGKADLELDGLRARPRPGGMLGAAPRGRPVSLQVG